MKTWLKRLALLLSAVWAFLAVASLYSVYLTRTTPDWYVPIKLTPTEQIAEANASDQKIADLFSYAGDVAAAQRRRFLAHPPTPNDIIGPKTVIFSERQINAFVTKWRSAVGISASSSSPTGRYVVDSRVVLLNDRLLVAGTLREMGILSNTIASIEFNPEIDSQGRLWPRLNGVYSGRLPVPAALYAKAQARFAAIISNDLDAWWTHAGIGPDGLANHYAAQAAAGKLLLASINGDSAQPIILLPCAIGKLHQAVPLRLVAIKIADKNLTATLRPFSDHELIAIISLFRHPLDQFRQ